MLIRFTQLRIITKHWLPKNLRCPFICVQNLKDTCTVIFVAHMCILSRWRLLVFSWALHEQKEYLLPTRGDRHGNSASTHSHHPSPGHPLHVYHSDVTHLSVVRWAFSSSSMNRLVFQLHIMLDVSFPRRQPIGGTTRESQTPCTSGPSILNARVTRYYLQAIGLILLILTCSSGPV